MNLRIFILIPFLLGWTNTSLKRESIFQVKIKWGEHQFKLDSSYVLGNNSRIKIDKFQVYLSNFGLKDGSSYKQKNSHYLIDASAENNSFTLPTKKVNKASIIEFQIGVDSIAQVSGAKVGALDPTNGLYWTWNSGYINLKMEGELRDSSGAVRPIMLHLGGYKYPFASSSKVTFPLKNNLLKELEIDLKNFWLKYANATDLEIMSPSHSAVEYIQYFGDNCISMK